jgi:hypothetical protein
LACCSRTAAEVTTRLPNAAVKAATARAAAVGSRRIRVVSVETAKALCRNVVVVGTTL